MNVKDFTTRFLVALFGIPVIFIAALIGKEVFLIFVDIVMLAALVEFYLMVKNIGVFPQTAGGVIFLLLSSLDIYFYHGRSLLLLLIFFIILTLLSELLSNNINKAENAAWTITGAVYVGLLMFFLQLRDIPEHFNIPYITGGKIIIVIFSIIWTCDTAAYIFGSSFGKHKLASKISPKKTVEGAVAGLITGTGMTILLGYLLLPELILINYIIIGIIIGIFGQLSDLVESMFKRAAGVKDSSNLLPGHGGMLDRFDNPILSVPVIYAYLMLFVF
ncbi:phosphatidate cytidylyltransferase [bacterium]|nr:phosphatidate cytidylyltransferase [bacterium]